MCRKGRLCPSHREPAGIEARNKRRREQYAATKNRGVSNSVEDAAKPSANSAASVSLTPAQASYFKGSKASVDGVPITVYHGSSAEFTEFDPARLGRGNDSWGNGFYFTDQESTAKGYAADTGTDTANVKDFYVNLQNPMYIDGKKVMSLNEVHFDSKAIANILKQHPDAYLQPDDEDNMNFVGDYCPEFWDKPSHTKAEMDKMIDKMSKEDFADANWVALEVAFGKEHGSAFLHAVSKETGHDGVVVDFGEAGKHYIAWFPNQMKLTSNQNPTDSNEF